MRIILLEPYKCVSINTVAIIGGYLVVGTSFGVVKFISCTLTDILCTFHSDLPFI